MTDKNTKRCQAFAYDDDRKKVYAGDDIEFTYGIPPVRVVAHVVSRGKKLVALTPGHTPAQCELRKLRSFVFRWWKIDKKKDMTKMNTESNTDKLFVKIERLIKENGALKVMHTGGNGGLCWKASFGGWLPYFYGKTLRSTLRKLVVETSRLKQS